MKTKHIVWALVIIAAIAIGVWAYRKYTAAKRLTVGIDSFDLEKSGILNALTDGIKARVGVLLGNYSNTPLALQQMNIQVYAPDGTLIASQTEPLQDEADIAANKNNVVPIWLRIPRSGIVALFKSMNVSLFDIPNRLSNYALNETLGATLYIKGFVQADGIAVDIDTNVKI